MRSRTLSTFRPYLLLAFLTLVLVPFGARVAAHEIPSNVTVRAFVKPEGDRLRLLVRVPLESIRDFNFPLRGPGYLELDRVEPILFEGARLWIADFLEIREENRPLTGESIVAARISIPSDRSFASYHEAIAHIYGPRVPVETELVWQQALMDVLIEYPITSDQSKFSIRSELAHLGVRTTTVMHFVPPTGGERVFQFTGDPGLVRLDPGWYQAASSFVKLGFEHILDGMDHLLFLLLLVLPYRRLLPLLAIVTSFTVAHSVTLIASALGMAPNALWFPPLIETLIALSIVFMAFENIVGANLRRRWLVAFGFGLVHGFGFSFVLRESLQFAGSHLLASLVAFNVGVEIGQVLVVLCVVPLLHLLFQHVVEARLGTILISALVAHTAWHWMAERFEELRQYQLVFPPLDLAFVAAAMRWLMLAIIVGVAVRLLSGAFERLAPRDGEPQAGRAPHPDPAGERVPASSLS